MGGLLKTWGCIWVNRSVCGSWVSGSRRDELMAESSNGNLNNCCVERTGELMGVWVEKLMNYE